MRLGLRIDVDTLRGTRVGVPCLLRQLRDLDVRASFFFSVGPDNMGRHVRRLLRPRFAMKMLRTRAASLYGWDILLRGTLWPGPEIGRRCADAIRAAADAGHEVGLHAWDHHRWQARVDELDDAAIAADLARGAAALTAITGRGPTCFAAPGWKAHAGVARAEADLGLRYASDCRGTSCFRVAGVDDRPAPPQVPVTLPTYDEMVGRDGVDADGFARHVVGGLRDEGLNVYTAHAEVEGIVAPALLAAIVGAVRERGGDVVPLGALLSDGAALPRCPIEQRAIPGRDGRVAVQGAAAPEDAA